MIEELLGPERRRRRSPQGKIAIIQETLQPGKAWPFPMSHGFMV